MSMFIYCRKRSEVYGYSLRSKSEGECCDPRDAKSCMLFPHLTLNLQHGKELKPENIQSDVIDKFPERSVLLQAQDGNDETQNELTLSSVTSQTESLQKVCKCTGDSSVIVSDEAVLTWRGREEENKSEPTITCVTGSFSNQPPNDHAQRVASKSSLQSHYVSSLDKSAGETPTNEVSPYYATTQEKQAFNKIKEWKQTFSIQLDQILQQRQGLSQLPVKNTKNKPDMRVSTSQYHDGIEANTNQKPTTSHLLATKSLPEKQALAHNMQHRVISELRAFSQMSVKSKEGSQISSQGKIILQEIKRQRAQIKCVHDENDLKVEIKSLEKQESHIIFHDLGSTSDTTKDINSFQQHTQLKCKKEVDMKIENKQNVSSTAVLCTTHPHSSESQVKEVLYSLRKTIDTIFTSTIQRMSDLMMITGSSESYPEFNSQHCDQLLRKMEVAKEERDSLCLENMNLKREISDLKRQLAKTLDERVGEIPIKRVDSLESTDSLVSQEGGDYVRIEEIHRVVSHFKEFAGGYGPNVEGTLSADSHGTYAGDFMPEIL